MSDEIERLKAAERQSWDWIRIMGPQPENALISLKQAELEPQQPLIDRWEMFAIMLIVIKVLVAVGGFALLGSLWWLLFFIPMWPWHREQQRAAGLRFLAAFTILAIATPTVVVWTFWWVIFMPYWMGKGSS